MQDIPEESKVNLENDKLITIAQAAEMFGVSRDTIRRWIKIEKIQVVRIQPYNKPRILLSTVLALIQAESPR